MPFVAYPNLSSVTLGAFRGQAVSDGLFWASNFRTAHSALAVKSCFSRMLENLERQKSAYLKAHGTPMSPSQNAHAIATMLALQSLYFEDSESEARPELNCAAYYASILPNSSTDPQILAQSLARSALARKSESGTAHSRSSYLKNVNEIGYAIGRDPTPEVAAICDELFVIQTQLARAGLPPQFVFVFNAAWELLDHLWASAANDVLGEGSVMEASFFPFSTTDLHVDCHTIQADMNCWALRRDSVHDGENKHYVGSNFGACHRDQRYSACHSAADGCPQSVNVWCAFNPSGANSCNGAMRVIPIHLDDYFYCPSNELHMDTATSLSFENSRARDAAVVLESMRGQACIWTPSLIHWGGSCSNDSTKEPRASIAVTFRSSDAPVSVFGAHDGAASTAPLGGPPPLLQEHLNNLHLKRRLAYVAKAILAYSHWHPGFPGVNL
jgi:hypothetical protein